MSSKDEIHEPDFGTIIDTISILEGTVEPAYAPKLKSVRTSIEQVATIFKKLKSKLDNTSDQLNLDTQKISNALKMTHEDAQMIMELRSDLQKVCSLLEASKDREDKQRHIILNLKSHIESLTDQLNHMSEEK